MKSKPFPPCCPDSLDDAGEIRRNDWTAFSSLSRMENHWEIKPWPPGTSSFYWYLTFGHDDALASTANACQDALESFPLRPVAVETLHMTLLKVGGFDTVESFVLERVIDNACNALKSVSRFELEVGPLAGSAGAIRFSVAPWSPVLDLVGRLGAAQESEPGLSPVKPGQNMRPHIGIAYSAARQPVAPILDTVAGLRELAPVATVVKDVKLVRLWRTDSAYEWEEKATISLL
ncbi:2'-5' RNA ligase family protein [Nocardia sp. NPDC050413]|uniref:2'-5' RNA ligase family protein n=1 Tax=Nocardia sp. NPDC050413 TaxID=3155784 RepID=UPI0033F8F5DA